MTGQRLSLRSASCLFETWTSANGGWHLVTDARGGTDDLASLVTQHANRPTCVVDEPIRDALIGRGWTVAREADILRHDLTGPVPEHTHIDMSVHRLTTSELPALAALSAAAYGEGHLDHRPGGVDAHRNELLTLTTDVDKPLVTEASLVAAVGSRPVGAAIVQLSQDFRNFRGPWLMTLFRDPAGGRGAGRLLLASVITELRRLRLGPLWLAVTVGNPAADLYFNVGFTHATRTWVLRPQGR